MGRGSGAAAIVEKSRVPVGNGSGRASPPPPLNFYGNGPPRAAGMKCGITTFRAARGQQKGFTPLRPPPPSRVPEAERLSIVLGLEICRAMRGELCASS